MTISAGIETGQLGDPAKSAEAVGLSYVTDMQPGIRRGRKGKGFIYRLASGQIVRDERLLARIRSLAIPPAWTDVWICRDPNGHLQATGRDARKRKQHRYHPRWREIRDMTKYSRLIAFAKALPAIRARTHRDLRQKGLSREKVLAAIVRLLEESLVRVGNDEYAKANNSFGLTTMKDRHVRITGNKLRFSFRGKSGIDHQVDIENPGLARVVRSCQELPGQDLFQYIDDAGVRQDVKSGDVNDYLREISGADFSAKDFRTWSGTVLAAMALLEFDKFNSQTEAKKNILRAIDRVSKKLGNTAAICRKCYVHPNVIDAYLDGTLVKTLKEREGRPLTRALRGLAPEEAVVLALLQQRLATRTDSASSEKRPRSLRRFTKPSIIRFPMRNRKLHLSRSARLA